MFRVHFDQLTLSIGSHVYTYPIEGAADIEDYQDSFKPKVVSLSLVPDRENRLVWLDPIHPVWTTLAEAVMETCAGEIADRFNQSMPKEKLSYADEHRLGKRDFL